MNNLVVVCINGFPLSGKDTFVKMVEKTAPKSLRVLHVSTVAPAKEALKFLGWDGITKSPEIRNALHSIKALSDSLFDTSMQFVKGYASRMLEDPTPCGLLFIDVREPEAISRFKKELGAYSLLVTRPGYQLEGIPNDADQRVRQYKYDKVIKNEYGLDYLQTRANEFALEVYNYASGINRTN